MRELVWATTEFYAMVRWGKGGFRLERKERRNNGNEYAQNKLKIAGGEKAHPRIAVIALDGDKKKCA